MSRDLFPIKDATSAMFLEADGFAHRQYREPDARYGWKDDSPYEHWFRFSQWPNEVEFDLPLALIPMFAALLPAAFVVRTVRSKRRQLRGRCPNCSYDLTGNTSGICPECGNAMEPVRAVG